MLLSLFQLMYIRYIIITLSQLFNLKYRISISINLDKVGQLSRGEQAAISIGFIKSNFRHYSLTTLLQLSSTLCTVFIQCNQNIGKTIKIKPIIQPSVCRQPTLMFHNLSYYNQIKFMG